VTQPAHFGQLYDWAQIGALNGPGEGGVALQRQVTAQLCVTTFWDSAYAIAAWAKSPRFALCRW
jgi:heme-degrading monooxygenase HmoA